MLTRYSAAVFALVATLLAVAGCDTGPTYVLDSGQSNHDFSLSDARYALSRNPNYDLQVIEQKINTSGSTRIDLNRDNYVDFISVREVPADNGFRVEFVACPTQNPAEDVKVGFIDVRLSPVKGEGQTFTHQPYVSTGTYPPGYMARRVPPRVEPTPVVIPVPTIDYEPVERDVTSTETRVSPRRNVERQTPRYVDDEPRRDTVQKVPGRAPATDNTGTLRGNAGRSRDYGVRDTSAPRQQGSSLGGASPQRAPTTDAPRTLRPTVIGQPRSGSGSSAPAPAPRKLTPTVIGQPRGTSGSGRATEGTAR